MRIYFKNLMQLVIKKEALGDISGAAEIATFFINVNNKDLLESKFSVSGSRIKDIKFPFSYYFMNQIDHYKNYYYEELDLLKQNSENINDHSKELHDELVKDHIEDFRNKLISTCQNFENLQKYSELYYYDFISIILLTYTTS